MGLGFLVGVFFVLPLETTETRRNTRGTQPTRGDHALHVSGSQESEVEAPICDVHSFGKEPKDPGSTSTSEVTAGYMRPAEGVYVKTIGDDSYLGDD